MRAGLDSVFVTVPRADDVRFGLVVFHGANHPVFSNRFEDALHDSTLADRPRAVCAPVVPSVKRAVDLEDPYLIAADDDLSIAVRIVGDTAGAVLH